MACNIVGVCILHESIHKILYGAVTACMTVAGVTAMLALELMT